MPTTTATRCACCDLPVYSCGTAALARIAEADPEYAEWLRNPGAPGTAAPVRETIGVHVPVGVRIAELRETLA